MTNEVLLCLTVFIPTLGALTLPILGGLSTKLRNFIAFGLVAAALIGSLSLLPAVLKGQTVTWQSMQLAGLGISLQADALAVFMAIVSSLVSAIIVAYSSSYVSHYTHQNEYYLMVVLFLGAMMGLVFAANLILLYVFWEITAIASWRLIGFFREKSYVAKADKAFLVTAFGALSMLLGFVVIYAQTGSFDLARIKGTALPDLAVVLIMLGILSKSATLPFHTWLPDAGVAPSPVTALLHAAVLVKIGVYVFARLFIVTFTYGADWHTVFMVLAAVSALVSAGAALIDTDLKRIIAYSTVSQIAFIFLGFAAGNEIGVAGALLYILMHGVAKGGLFLCAGIVEQKTHTKDIRQMGGLVKTMPITAVSFLLCSLSVMGVPPFGGFFSKYMVISGAVQSDHLWLAATFVFGAVLTILYLFRAFNQVFLGTPLGQTPREGSPIMVGSVALLAAMSLLSGLIIQPSAQFAYTAVRQMLGVVAK
ncbi:MAG: NADH-quinone oxidoreductase subunit L [Phycisphaerae bacterium]|jgi:proton-translocating NADH-quinone oxidoreductase chain N